jgi:vacuolar-type H+-ATPase subunit H
VSRLSVLLERFRRTAGVPAVPVEAFEAELAPVFAALEEVEADATRVRDRGRAEAAERLTAAKAERERITSAWRPSAEAERARVAAVRRAAAEDEAHDIVAQAEIEASRVRERGGERIPALVDSVLARVRGTGE